MTGPGTNTYLIGNEAIVILDPGEDQPEHLAAILSAVRSDSIYAIVPTHAHPDHWPLAPRLSETLKAPTAGFAARNGFAPDRLVRDGDVLQGPDWTLEAVHAPGHCSDHVCYYLREERALFTGDHVMGWSTTVIGQPDGDLNSYMGALRRLRDMDASVMYPAHGRRIMDPRARIDELIAHREMRTRQLLEALAQGPATVPELVERIYTDVDPRLHSIARQSVLAHLNALLETGAVCPPEDAGQSHSVYKLR
jgi:glyoxylase-like metal-dependent hydrolase (beta-lactamase superfamily II)